MAQPQPITKVEMYDHAWGGFTPLSYQGSRHSGVFTSTKEADAYAREVVSRSPRRAVRITTEGQPSYVLRNRGNFTTGPRIVRTTA